MRINNGPPKLKKSMRFGFLVKKGGVHEITKYGIHSFTQIALAVDKQLTYRQDSAPDWLNKSSRQLVICIYRQRTNKLTKG